MLIYVGTNPMVSHAHNTGMFNPAVFIRAVAERGEVWTIDPVLTETAKFSTRHIAAYPGKDYAILAWLTREIIDGGPLDLQQPVNGLDGAARGARRLRPGEGRGDRRCARAGARRPARRHSPEGVAWSWRPARASPCRPAAT